MYLIWAWESISQQWFRSAMLCNVADCVVWVGGGYAMAATALLALTLAFPAQPVSGTLVEHRYVCMYKHSNLQLWTTTTSWSPQLFYTGLQWKYNYLHLVVVNLYFYTHYLIVIKYFFSGSQNTILNRWI